MTNKNFGCLLLIFPYSTCISHAYNIHKWIYYIKLKVIMNKQQKSLAIKYYDHGLFRELYSCRMWLTYRFHAIKISRYCYGYYCKNCQEVQKHKSNHQRFISLMKAWWRVNTRGTSGCARNTLEHSLVNPSGPSKIGINLFSSVSLNFRCYIGKIKPILAYALVGPWDEAHSYNWNALEQWMLRWVYS